MKQHKTITIGDIHGKNTWKQVVEKHPDCHIVFLGDYCDPYDNLLCDTVIDNLKEIIYFKKQNEENVTLLLGNHDTHYFHPYSGRGSRYDFWKANELREIFTHNRQLFVYAHEINNLLFTHAGVVQGWYIEEFSTSIDNIADRLNNPEKYNCNSKALFQCGHSRGGMNRYGGIFWADRSELYEPLTGYTHIVGHNRVSNITPLYTNGTEHAPGVIFCDSLFNDNYLIIESDEDGNNIFHAANINNDRLILL